MVKLYAVRLRTMDYAIHVYLIEATNLDEAKNLGEAKFYEKHLNQTLDETKTQVWEVAEDFSSRSLNPSKRR